MERGAVLGSRKYGLSVYGDEYGLRTGVSVNVGMCIGMNTSVRTGMGMRSRTRSFSNGLHDST